jgi:uncharacterized protein (TIGR02466 family)
MAIDINEIKTFYTSLYTVNIPPGVELEQIAKSLEATGNSKTQASNSGGWQSEKQTYDSIKYVQPFLDKLLILINKIYKEFNISKEPELIDYWFNINRKNNFNWSHKHPHSFFSAVFYIKFPKNSGNLVLERPDSLRDFLEINKINERNSDSVTFKPNNNDLIFFPSYIRHRVEQSNSDDERITIAFNFR